ncbi:MAG: hypothetical protein Q9208_003582 [Pyrenodesmia sp. 3 TL-2023]
MAECSTMTAAWTLCRLHLAEFDPVDPTSNIDLIGSISPSPSLRPGVLAPNKKRAKPASEDEEEPRLTKLVKRNHQSRQRNIDNEGIETMKPYTYAMAVPSVPPPSGSRSIGSTSIASSATAILSDVFQPTPPPSPRPSTASAPIPRLLVTPPSPKQSMTFKPNGYWRPKRRPSEEPIYNDLYLNPPRRSFGNRTARERLMDQDGTRRSVRFLTRPASR